MLPKLILAISLTPVVLVSGFASARTFAASPSANTITVNIQGDGADALPNGTCETGPGNGVCTLRAAIEEANFQAGAQIITVPTGNFALDRSGNDDTAQNGDLDIAGDTTLKGAGPANTTIDASGLVTHDRVFHILKGATVEISGVTIRGGRTNYGDGAGIWNRGYLTLRNAVVTNNYGAEYGGGVSNANTSNEPATLLLINSIVEYNQSHTGGGIENKGTMTLMGSTIRHNSSYQGGGIRENTMTTSTIINSTISDNHASLRQDGWGGDGGGIFLSTKRMDIVNSTISGNRASHHGGAIYVRTDYDQTANLLNVTVTKNWANTSSANGMGGGIYSEADVHVLMHHTILADNVVQGSGFAPRSHDCYGELYSLGNNLLGRSSYCSGIVDGVLGNKVGTHLDPLNARLEDLANNGGLTETHALKSNSPAIDAGNPFGCVDAATVILTTDQRGYSRPVGAACDMGAYEYGGSAPTATPSPTIAPPTLTPTATPPSGCASKPAAAEFASPDQNQVFTKRTIKLDWNDANCATKYKVRVRQDQKKGLMSDRKTVNESKYKTVKLDKGHQYYWLVKACNTHGCTKSAWRIFEVQ